MKVRGAAAPPTPPEGFLTVWRPGRICVRAESFLCCRKIRLWGKWKCFGGIAKWFFLWSVAPLVKEKLLSDIATRLSFWSAAPPARGAGGIPTSPLCPPGPPIPPSNGRGIPPDPPCTGRGTSPCNLTDRSRNGYAHCLAWGPQPIGCRGTPALCLAS